MMKDDRKLYKAEQHDLDTTGTLFRTSTDKLRQELGWDRLSTRREINRQALFWLLVQWGGGTIAGAIGGAIVLTAPAWLPVAVLP